MSNNIDSILETVSQLSNEGIENSQLTTSSRMLSIFEKIDMCQNSNAEDKLFVKIFIKVHGIKKSYEIFREVRNSI